MKTLEHTLDSLLEKFQVDIVDDHINETNGGGLTAVLGWYYVSTDDDGIIAYFMNESDALRFRISEINRILNG